MSSPPPLPPAAVPAVARESLLSAVPPTEAWTVGHWGGRPSDGRRYEILDGALLVSPPATPLRQEVVHRIMAMLGKSVPPGAVVARDVGIVLGASVLAPDVVVLRGAPQESTVGADLVLLAVEVADGANVTTARTTTPQLLAAAGVPAYWRMEPHAGPAVVLHRLAADAYTVEGRLRDEQTQTLTSPFQVTVTPRRWMPGSA